MSPATLRAARGLFSGTISAISREAYGIIAAISSIARDGRLPARRIIFD